VANLLLDQALDLFDSTQGSLMLLDAGAELRSAAARGNRLAATAIQPRGQGVAGHVAVSKKSLLLNGRASPKRFAGAVDRERTVTSAMLVPVTLRDEVLGVLNINAPTGRTSGERDLRLLEAFAADAAPALANARLHAAHRARLAELDEAGRRRNDVMSKSTLELRAGVDELVSGLDDLRGSGLPASAVAAVETLQGQARNMAATVREILSVTEVEEGNVRADLAAVDVGSILVSLAAENSLAGRTVELQPVPDCFVLADPALMEQVLWNVLVHVHDGGEPPVRIGVEVGNGVAAISVFDRRAGDMGLAGLAPLSAEGAAERGLAVTLATQVVESWGGEVLATENGDGTAVAVRLPAPGANGHSA
jgi:K+-sensing histidine kinase KdpD